MREAYRARATLGFGGRGKSLRVVLLGGEVRGLDLRYVVISDVGEVHDDGIDDGVGALGGEVELSADDELEVLEADDVLVSAARHGADVAELVDRGGRVAPSAHAVERQEARVVPVLDELLLDERPELALRDDVVRDVQARELPHERAVQLELLQEPVVQLASDLELERADGVGDPLQTVADAVREVVQRVDAPLIL